MDSQSPSPPYLDEPTNSGSNGSRTPYLSFTPKRSIASFENLVALANYQERLKDARKMVWRDRGQPVTDLPDLKACLEHAATGGLSEDAFVIRRRQSLIIEGSRISDACLWHSSGVERRSRHDSYA